MLSGASDDPMSDLLATFDRQTQGLPDGTLTLVGFSIGAMAAIKIAAARPDRIRRLTLISLAAPLSLEDFLPDMAGKPVFELAINHPWMLKVLTHVQGFSFRIAPRLLLRKMFENCGTSEKALLRDSRFRSIILRGMLNSYCTRPKRYNAFLQAYVNEWSASLQSITCPVEIWHGNKDTWSPPAMATRLQEEIPATCKVHWVEDGEHYSTLQQTILGDDPSTIANVRNCSKGITDA